MHRGREGSCSLPAGAAARGWEMPGLIQPVRTGNSGQILQLWQPSVLQADPRDRAVSLPPPASCLCHLYPNQNWGCFCNSLSSQCFWVQGCFPVHRDRLGFPFWYQVLKIIQKVFLPSEQWLACVVWNGQILETSLYDLLFGKLWLWVQSEGTCLLYC